LLPLPNAVEAYTMGSAFAEFQEKEKGSITPGKLADMVILGDNIFDRKPNAIRNVGPLSRNPLRARGSAMIKGFLP
jgi:predicted amidohydrolase YtcJ